MKERVIIKPDKGETLSQALYRTPSEAFNNLTEFNTYIFKEYGGWIFEFYFDPPDNFNSFEYLIFHFEIYYKFDEHPKELVSQKIYKIEFIDTEPPYETMQKTADKIGEDIDEFWDNSKSLKPAYPRINNEIDNKFENRTKELWKMHDDFMDELRDSGFDPDIELDRG